METFPKPNQPGWQDITFEMIESEIETGNIQNALFLCNLRKEALEGVLRDIDATTVAESDNEFESASSVTSAQWEEERCLIQKEIDELNEYIQKIQSSSDT